MRPLWPVVSAISISGTACITSISAGSKPGPERLGALGRDAGECDALRGLLGLHLDAAVVT